MPVAVGFLTLGASRLAACDFQFGVAPAAEIRQHLVVSGTPLDQLVGQEIDTVSFVLDYVELRIDYSVVRAFTEPHGVIDGLVWRLGDPGAAETLRKYIGRTVLGVDVADGEVLSLTLSGDATFVISLRPEDRVGVEAAHFVPALADGQLNVASMCIW